jgi:hypothetical protein
MNGLNTILDAYSLVDQITEILKKGDYKTTAILKKIGMDRSSFYRKVKNKELDVKELLLLAPYLFPEEWEDYEDSQMIKAIEEGKKSEILSYEESEAFMNSL